MAGALSIEEIQAKTIAAAEELVSFCRSLNDQQFFFQPQDKWSPAQQVKHLVTSTNTARLAFILPKIIVRLVGGKPNRQSRTFDELVNRYQLKLQQGGRASGRYIPKAIPASNGKENLLHEFALSMEKFGSAVKNKWKENKLDDYLAPHPLLGKITLRELCYFTIYHTTHHLHSIKNFVSNNKP